jgi:hypothetical protein
MYSTITISVLMELKCIAFKFYHMPRCVDSSCQGIGLGGQCAESVDCYPDLYCNMGICSSPISMGSDCTYDNQCGRKGACFFKSNTSLTGKCTNLFSVPNNYLLNLVQSSPNGEPIGINDLKWHNN